MVKKKGGSMALRKSLGIALLVSLIVCTPCLGEILIDEFNKGINLLGGRTAVYQKAPSRALAMQSPQEHYGPLGKALVLKYDKRGTGGPYGTGGWCGYYTLLKKGNKYFNGSGYKSITFYVKGAGGGENFKIGLADKHWDKVGDSVKSETIGSYLPSGKITGVWQKATVPLDAFFVDYKELASIAVCFETDCFPEGAGRGTVYIDQLKLE